MLPDMSGVLDRFLQNVTIGTVTQTVVNHRPVDTHVDLATQAVVQPANKEKLNPDIVDWSLIYKQVHSKVEIKIGDFLTVSGKKYKAVELGDYNEYGYYETIFEEVK